MAIRLPQPGGDDGTWGDLLNSFLEVSHDTVGNLLPAALQAAGGVTSINGQQPVSGVVTLAPSDIGSGDAVSLQGVGIDASTPSDGQALVYNGTAAQWAPATITSSGSVGNATSSTPGLVQLTASGDVVGTATNLKVQKIQNVVSLPSGAPSSGQVLTATNGSTAAWQTPATAPVTSVAGKTGVVTLVASDVGADASGAAAAVQSASLQKSSNLSDVASASTARTNLGLGSAATISSTAGGDLSGTLPNPTVAKVNGVTVSGAPSGSGQVLTATSTSAAGWSTPSSGFADPTTTKGDLIVHGSSTTRLAVGTNGQVLTADSTQTLGVKWATPSASGGGYNVVAKTVNYSASSGDFVVGNPSSAGFTVTLPAAAAGAYVRIKKTDTGSNAILVVAQSGQIDGSNSVSINGQYESQDFMSDGTLWYQV